MGIFLDGPCAVHRYSYSTGKSVGHGEFPGSRRWRCNGTSRLTAAISRTASPVRTGDATCPARSRRGNSLTRVIHRPIRDWPRGQACARFRSSGARLRGLGNTTGASDIRSTEESSPTFVGWRHAHEVVSYLRGHGAKVAALERSIESECVTQNSDGELYPLFPLSPAENKYTIISWVLILWW